MAVPFNSPYGWSMLEIPSSPSVYSSTNLGGTNVIFTIEGSDNVVYKGKNSYISIQLQIVQTRENGVTNKPLEPIINTGTRAAPTAISVPYLCPNPAAVFFDTIKANSKGVEVCNFQFGAYVNTLYRTCFESKLENESALSTSKITPMDQDDQDVIKGVPYDNYVKLAASLGVTEVAVSDFSLLFTKRMIWALKNQMYNFDRHNVNRINLQIPIPLFYVDELLHFGTDKVELVFGISPSWYSNIMQIAGSSHTTLAGGDNGTEYVVTNKHSEFTACSINCSVLDMKLYLNRGHITETYIPRDGKKAKYYLQ